MRQKVLIVGPFEDCGGREVDTAFIALALTKIFNVQICSIGNITRDSQIYTAFPETKVTSLKKEIYQNYSFFKPATVISYFRNKKKKPIYFYTNNKINLKLGYKKREYEEIYKLVQKFDLIFIRSHIFTNKIREVIEIASGLKKKIIFRTTGAMEKRNFWPQYLYKVDLFIHHSTSNANILHPEVMIEYNIIDQSAISEEKLLKIPALNRSVKNFAVIGRLSPEKNILKLISYFKNSSSADELLYIIGNGDMVTEIAENIKDKNNIVIIGQLGLNELANFYQNIDCLVLSSFTEAGPLVGVEAMAAGRVILSTKVGAMPERLQETYNDFWFEPDDERSFREQFERVKSLDPSQVCKIAHKNREVYLQKYSKGTIAEEYLNSVKQILKNR